MNLWDGDPLTRVKRGDMKTLCQLDARGLTPAPGEDAEGFAMRLEALQQRFQEFQRDIGSSSGISLEGLKVDAASEIPRENRREPNRQTERLYGFECDWVPGFFCNPRASWLFGGCTYTFPPTLFTVFIIGERLRAKKRHLFYDRDEILAHEVCHVARASLNSTEFEEHFAYQTARSAFRRSWGGIMHTQMDSFAFMLACLALVVCQLLNATWHALPAWTGWTVFAATALFFVLRHARTRHVFKKALENLKKACKGDERRARILAFHATDRELHQLAKAKDINALLQKFTDLRWKIALQRRMKE